MTSTIDKKAERHTAAEMMKRDGETYMAVGIFILALAVPVLIGTLWALERPHAAVVNAIAGIILAALGSSAIAYGWRLFKRATQIPSLKIGIQLAIEYCRRYVKNVIRQAIEYCRELFKKATS